MKEKNSENRSIINLSRAYQSWLNGDNYNLVNALNGVNKINLNNKYINKFGFPFILAVRGYHRAEILEIFKKRIRNKIEIEFNEALMQVHRIALLRLNEIE